MARIIVKDGNWDEACAALKTALSEQDAKFAAKIKAALGPSPSVAKPQAPAVEPQAPTAAELILKRGEVVLSRSRRHS